MRSWQEKNDIKFIQTIMKKNIYFDILDDVVNKYNNTCYSTIKMKPVDIKSSTYINLSKETNDKDPKFKIDDIVTISKYKNILQKAMLKIALKKFL